MSVPDLYYRYSNDFDYRKYLEQKSHFDRVEVAVNSSTDRLLGSSEAIARTLGVSLTTINENLGEMGSRLNSINSEIREQTDVLVDGFFLMSAGLSEISTGIDDLRAVTEFGFAELLNSSYVTNNLISELVTVVSTPEQTWSKEQFDLARQCAVNDLWPEALEYVEKAINGVDGKEGLKIEPTFYYFRGTIFLGNYNGGTELLDLNSAFDDFQLCSRYCAKKNDRLKSEALVQAGWCKYLLGEVSESVALYQAALDVSNESSEAKYLLAKSYLHLGQVEQAEPAFKGAINRTPLFVSRAFLDADFLSYISDVENWAENVRFSRQKDLKATFEQQLNPDLQRKIEKLTGISGVPVEINDRVYRLEETLGGNQGLLVLEELEHEMRNDLSGVPAKYNEAIIKFEEHVARLKSKKPETRLVEDSLSSRVEKKGVSLFETGGLFLIVGLLLGGIYAIYYSASGCLDEKCGPIGWTLQFPLISIMAAIVTIPIGGAAGFAIGFAVGIFRKLNATAEADKELNRDKAEAEEIFNVELRQIKEGNLLAEKIEKELLGIRDQLLVETAR